jgi:glycosyltransferase involved in cell wall biosynthesis
MHVAFINENTLGHRSYLLPFFQALEADAPLGITPYLIDASPLPDDLRRFGETSVKLLRRWGLDFGATRWRLAASVHARRQVAKLQSRVSLDAVVVNTQSVGLALSRWPGCPRIFVCLDATFAQLSRSPWFAHDLIGRVAAPFTLEYLRRRERELFRSAAGFLPWSESVVKSLQRDYNVPSSKIHLLPPSVSVQKARAPRPSQARKRILFLGGDFKRKGGPLVLEAFRRYLRSDSDLDIVTQSRVPCEPGVSVHCGVNAHSAEWLRRWHEADVFVFPSTLETFGIVLLEALSFGVPVVSSRAGAAAEILDEGVAGLLLADLTPATIAANVRLVFADPASTSARVAHGVRRVAERYSVDVNTDRLAGLLRAAIGNKEAACAS